MKKAPDKMNNREKEIEQLLEFSRANWEQSYETSNSYGLRALKNAKDIGSRKLICDACNVLTVTHYFVGHNKKALHYGTQALEYLDRENKNQALSVYNNLGMVYFRLYELEKCLDCYLKSLYYSALLQMNEKISVNLTNIGGVYWESKTDKFEHKNLESLTLLKDALEAGEIASPLVRNLISQIDKLSNQDLAYEFFSSALEMFEEHSTNPRLYANVLQNLGLWNSAKRNFEEAQAYFRKATQITEKLQLHFLLPNIYLSSAKNFLDMHEYEHAFEDCRKAIILAWKYKIREEFTNGFFLMSSIHQERGRLKTAISSLHVHCKLTHSLYVDRHTDELELLQEQYEKKIKDLSLEIDRLKVIVNAKQTEE